MTNSIEMTVKKRDGNIEPVSFDKILNRIKTLGKYNNDDLNINYTSLVMKVIDQLYDGIATTEIDELSAQQCASMATIHPDYGKLGARILIANHHRDTDRSFSNVMKKLYNFKDVHNVHYPKISEQLYQVVNLYFEVFLLNVGLVWILIARQLINTELK